MLGHSFKFKQDGNTSLGCSIVFDGKPFYCQGFKLETSAGDISILEARIILNSVDVNIDGKRLVVNRLEREVDEIDNIELELN